MPERGVGAALDILTYIGRAITPTPVFRRFNTRFFLADGDAVFGDPASSDELEDVGWHPIGRKELVPFRDVTQFMLARAVAVRDGTAPSEVPLFCTVRKQAAHPGLPRSRAGYLDRLSSAPRARNFRGSALRRRNRRQRSRRGGPS